MIAAADLLLADFGIEAEIWSATSFGELARDARAIERWNRLHPVAAQRTSHVAKCLGGAAPIVAATDYVRAYPQTIASFVGAPFLTLGTDGFGRSDTRAKLRRFFEVDRFHIAVAALQALAAQGASEPRRVAEAIARYGLDPEKSEPWMC